MIKLTGRAAVWDHAGECGMQEKIKQIAAIFDVSDINIYSPGKLTYLHPDRPPERLVRVQPGVRGYDIKAVLAESKEVKKRYKK